MPVFILLVSKGFSTKMTFQSLVTAMLCIAMAQKSAAILKALIAVKALKMMRPTLVAVPCHTVFEQAWAFWTLEKRNRENLSGRSHAHYS